MPDILELVLNKSGRYIFFLQNPAKIIREDIHDELYVRKSD